MLKYHYLFVYYLKYYLFIYLFICGCRWNSWNFFACGINETVIKETGLFFRLPMLHFVFFFMSLSLILICIKIHKNFSRYMELLKVMCVDSEASHWYGCFKVISSFWVV